MAPSKANARLQQLTQHSTSSSPSTSIPSTTTSTPQNVSEYLSSLYSLTGKTALITGAPRGLGRQIALALASAGADLILLVRSPSSPTVTSLVKTVESMGRKVDVWEADLLKRETYLDLLEQKILQKEGTGPDIFVHSAGLQHRQPAVEFDVKRWDEIIEVNLTAAFLMSQALARSWLKRAPTGGYPSGQHKRIIMLGSVLSKGPGSMNIPAYTSTKGGIRQLVKGLSNEWAKFGVGVNAVAPGYFSTELTRQIRGTRAEDELMTRVPLGRWGRGREGGAEEDIEGNADGVRYGDLEGTVVWLCGRGGEFVTGETVLVDGGYSGR